MCTQLLCRLRLTDATRCVRQPAPIYILDEVDAALDLSHTQNIGRMIRTHFPQSQFIVVSLKEGMFNNANVIFRTKVRRSFGPDPAQRLHLCLQFVDGVSTVMRTVPALKDMPPGANHVRAAQRRSHKGAAVLKPAGTHAGATRGGEAPARGAGRCAEREHGALELHACARTGCQSGMFVPFTPLHSCVFSLSPGWSVATRRTAAAHREPRARHKPCAGPGQAPTRRRRRKSDAPSRCRRRTRP